VSLLRWGKAGLDPQDSVTLLLRQRRGQGWATGVPCYGSHGDSSWSSF